MATRACSKGIHRIDDVTFQLKRPKVIIHRDDVILICNVNQSSSEEFPSMYLEKLCGSAPIKVEYNYDRSVIMATFSGKLGKNLCNRVP